MDVSGLPRHSATMSYCGMFSGTLRNPSMSSENAKILVEVFGGNLT